MFKKLKASLISMLLVLSLSITPAASAFAAPVPESTLPSVSEAQLKAFATDSSDSIEEIAKKRAKMMTSVYQVSNLQYALIDNGNIILSDTAGYNDAKKKNAVTDENYYGIASISKMFTTVAVLKLAEEKKLDLDAPVVNYIPEFKMADNRYKDITVRMLLNHSSGLMGSTLSQSVIIGGENTYVHDHFLEILKKQRLKADPGKFSVYCNDGFLLAELVVERVTNKSFTDYITETICKPLGMDHTKTPSSKFDRKQMAGIFDAKGNRLSYESLCSYGAGGLYSTAEDLCKFSTIFTKPDTLLSKETIDATRNEEYKRGQWYPDDDSMLSYGLGWDSIHTYPFTQYGITALVKGGDSFYYHSGLVVLPDLGISIAVTSSAGSSSLDELFGFSILLDYLKSIGKIAEIKPVKTFDAPKKVSIPDSFKKYEGFYGNFSVPMKVEMKSTGELTLSTTGKNASSQSFVYTGNDRFYSPDGSAFVSFIEKEGNTYIYQSGYTSVPSLGQIALSCYLGQKLTENKISSKVKKAWDKYLGHDYYLVSEPYNSAVYISELPKAELSFVDGLENYIDYMPIYDETTTKSYLEIPGMYGRDLGDLELINKNGTKYIRTGISVMLCDESIKNLSTKKSFHVTIPSNGYAQYFKISKKSANKTVTVNMPKKSSFTVYDKNGAVVSCSYVTGKNKVKLPKGGMIVFVGSKKADFKVSYK